MSGESERALAEIDAELAKRGVAPQSPELAQIDMELARRKAKIPPSGDFMHEVPRAIGQNIGAQVASGYAGLAGAVLPGPQGQGAAWQKKTQEALSYEPESDTSKAIMKGVSAPFEHIVEPASEYVGSKISDAGSPALGATVKGAIQAAPTALGLRGMKGAPASTVNELAKKYAMGLTPTESGGGVISKIVEGLSGEEKLSKGIARKNAAAGAQALGEGIGIPADVPLSRESIAKARQDAHAPYEEARSLGDVTPRPEYGAALDAMEAQYKNASKSFPKGQSTIAKDIMDTIEGHRVDKFDASAAVDEVRSLREAADGAYKQGQGALGKVYKGISKAIEDEVFAHAEKSGNTGLAGRLNSARQRIAKTYEADKVLQSEGAINPQKLVEMEKRKVPLSGASKDIAQLAERAPRSMRRDTGGNTMFPTWADAIMAGLTGSVEGAAHGLYSGGAAVPAALIARPLARAVMSSKPYQRFQQSALPHHAKDVAQRSVLLGRRLQDEQ